MNKFLLSFNPYVICGSIFLLAGGYSMTDSFQTIPKIFMIIGYILIFFGYAYCKKIERALSMMRKNERR